ncbi:MAG TPA: hydroxymethylbilane synthase [Anaerolineae bacterium]|nr:hydroxymethylbilane synthase [Anaerolineae bacterium]
MISFSARTLTVGTRPSQLARWQTNHVIRCLQRARPECDCRIVTFTTTGDKTLDRPLPEIGGKGLFTEELAAALRSGEIDIAVHSLKDLPIDDAPGLIISAISTREDARDVLISREGWTLATLPQGARVGTSSLRRSAQLLAARPDLTLLPLRGNVDTRIRKALQGDYDAIVLAAAGVLRLGLSEHITEYVSFDVMLPAPGQGALAVQCREDDAATRNLLSAIDDPASRAAVTAERTFLDALGGGCSAPVAAYAECRMRNAECRMTGIVASLDGRRVIRVLGAGSDPVALGQQLARQALAQGAGELLQ